MISRRFSSSSSSLSFSLIVGLLSNHRHSCCLHHYRRGCYCLMAASSSSTSYSLLSQGSNYKNDPSLLSSCNSNKGFHFLPYTALHLKPATKTIIIKSAAGNDSNINSNSSSCSNGNNNTKSLYKARRPRAFAPSLPQLLGRDSDKANGLVEETNNCHDPNWFKFNNNGAYHTIGLPDEPLPEKLVVAVDVDEVLGNFVSALNRFIADRYSLNHSVSEYHVYEFFKIWNCSRVEADIRVHEFFKTSFFKTGIHPIPGALQALKRLSRFCNLSVVTSRQNAIKDHTIEWIEQHFPGLFQEIQFGNHFALDGQSRPKSDICRSLGAKVLIDDNPTYAAECAEAGIKVLLFDYENSYPWCKTESVAQHPLVVKVHNWEEVEHQLVSQNSSRTIS